jgi:cellulose biosynthesis protein BcsQ
VFAVALLSLKGGVGKTTVTLGLAGAAVTRGLRTLVVDLDPQANATLALDVPSDGATVAEVFADPSAETVAAALRPSSWTGELRTRPGAALDVLVGHGDLLRHDVPEPSSGLLHVLAEALARLPEQYDVVLLDCPPSLGRLTRTALVAAQRALVVTEPSFFAVHGAHRAFRAVQEQRALNPGLQPLGVIVNRYDARMVEHRFRYEELRELFGPLVLFPPLPDRTIVAQAQGMALPLHRWRTSAAREATDAFDNYLARVLRAVERTTTHEARDDDLAAG